MKVWVIMGNDYPEAVCNTEEGANKRIAECKKEQTGRYGPRAVIYWRSYGDIQIRKQIREYLIALVIVTIPFFTLFEYVTIPFIWWPTWFLLWVFIIAQIVPFIEPIFQKKK